MCVTHKPGGEKYKVYTEVEPAAKDPNLIILDLSGKNLSQIPKEVLGLKNLYRLNVGDNQIKSIDPQICSLAALRVLILSRNPVTSFPDCFFEMDLEVLSLLGCGMRELPARLGKMKKLERLVIGGNSFTESRLYTLKEELPNCAILTSVD